MTRADDPCWGDPDGPYAFGWIYMTGHEPTAAEVASAVECMRRNRIPEPDGGYWMLVGARRRVQSGAYARPLPPPTLARPRA